MYSLGPQVKRSFEWAPLSTLQRVRTSARSYSTVCGRYTNCETLQSWLLYSPRAPFEV